jgi:hypothetical protein
MVEGRQTETEQQITKKTMKTKSQNKKSGLKSRPEPLNTKQLLKIDFALRRANNRGLKTENLLALLRSQRPNFFDIAEVVGKWVWIQFDGKQPVTITSVLSELGFHWNNTRQTWQHPCGTITDEWADYDPRTRYGSYFAADVLPS